MKKIIALGILLGTCSIYAMEGDEEIMHEKPPLNRGTTYGNPTRIFALAREDFKQMPLLHPDDKPKTGECCQACILAKQSPSE